MISITPKLTDGGMSLLMRCIGGEKITFTRFKIGNGEASGDGSMLLDLVNPLLEFGIASVNADESGYLELNGTFSNDAIESDFRWTELGLFAKGEDEEEMLYAYICDAENASMLRSGGADVMIEQNVSVIVAVGTAQNVTALISASALYASKPEFDEHLRASNPHQISAGDVGLGNVPNVSTNNQTPTYKVPDGSVKALSSGEKLTTAFGKIARAIQGLIEHLADRANPHKVTADQAGAAKKEHQHSASDINSGTLSATRGGTGVTSIADLKSLLAFPISNFASGTYEGDDDSQGRFIRVGFNPRLILIIAEGHSMYENGFHFGCISISNHEETVVVSTVGTHVHPWANGFMVYQESGMFININKSGEKYGYIAIR